MSDLYTPLDRAPRWHQVALRVGATTPFAPGETVIDRYDAVVLCPYLLANLGACLRDAGALCAAADQSPGVVVERTAARLCDEHGCGWKHIGGEEQSAWIGDVFAVLHRLKVDEDGRIYTLAERGYEEELENERCTSAMLATDRDDAQADADRVAHSWHELKAAALAVIAETSVRPGSDRHTEAMARLLDAARVEMPGGGESRAERYRKALEEIANHPHAADLPAWDGCGSSLDHSTEEGHGPGHRCAAKIARAALEGGGEGK